MFSLICSFFAFLNLHICLIQISQEWTNILFCCMSVRKEYPFSLHLCFMHITSPYLYTSLMPIILYSLFVFLIKNCHSKNLWDLTFLEWHVFSWDSNCLLLNYAGIYWNRNQSGGYETDYTSISKAGNKDLRYYSIEAADSIRCHEPSFAAYYRKKYGRPYLITTNAHSHSCLVRRSGWFTVCWIRISFSLQTEYM